MSLVFYAILIAVALLMFFGIITFETKDLNAFFNLLRDVWGDLTS